MATFKSIAFTAASAMPLANIPMRKLVSTAALALCLSATAAQAEMKKISASGYWEADAGTSDRGNPMCMVETHGTADDGSKMSFMIKYDTHRLNQLSYQFYKQSWNIPARQEIRVALRIDNAPGRVFTGTQVRRDMIDFEIELGALDPKTGEEEITYLANLLRSGRLLRVSFPDGNETDWGVPLEGANGSIGAMQTCIGYLAKQAGQTTQPYSDGTQSATQPNQRRQQLPETHRTTEPYTPL